MTENDMVMDCYDKLRIQENIKEVVLEVPYLSRCIDMVLVDNLCKIITIEFKLKNWRKALEQAKDHSLGSDRAYICIPKPKRISDKLVEESRKIGIGILFYDSKSKNPIEEFMKPTIKRNKWNPRVVSLKIKINKISGKEVFNLS